MRDMSNFYFNSTTEYLRRLKGVKETRLRALRRKPVTYLGNQEIKRLEFALSRIDAVLRSRAAQGLLFP